MCLNMHLKLTLNEYVIIVFIIIIIITLRQLHICMLMLLLFHLIKDGRYLSVIASVTWIHNPQEEVKFWKPPRIAIPDFFLVLASSLVTSGTALSYYNSFCDFLR